MATIALALAGQAIGTAIGGASALAFGITAGAIGGAVGAAVGGYIDSQFLLPALFSNDSNFQGARLDDLRIQTASEGSPINYVLGHKNKVAGTVIWKSELIEETESQEVGGKGGGGATSTSYKYYVDVAIAVCEGEIFDISKIYANGKKIYANGDNDHRTTSITIYKGTTSQLPNSLMEAYEGVGNVPAYRGITYVVFEHLALADFGNALPNLTFDVEAVDPSTPETVAGAIGKILERCNLTSSDYDVSDLPAITLYGYTIAGEAQGVAQLEPIMAANFINAQLNNGVLRFFQRGDEDVVTVDEDDLGAREFDGGIVRPFPVADVPSSELPSEVLVTYFDTSTHLQSGTQRARRFGTVAENVSSINLPLSLTPTKARQFAEARLWTSWGERSTVRLSLPPSYLHIQEGDVISVQYQDELYSVRVSSVDRGINMLHEIQGIITDSETVESDASGEDGTWVDPSLYTPPDMTLVFADGPALREADINTVGGYFLTCADDYAAQFLGAAVYSSSDGTTFGVLAGVGVEATIGLTDAAVGSTTVQPDSWDNVNTIDVTLQHGELTSATEDEVLAGKNWAFLGSELLAFCNVTSLGANQYRLSKLLRGMRDTFDSIATHGASGEKFALLNVISSVGFYNYGLANVGLTRYLKSVAVGDVESGVSAISFTANGGCARGFSPACLTAIRDFSSNDWAITWIRRTRSFTKFLQSAPTPIEEPFERYDLEILNGSTVVRTVTLDDLTSFTYTSAMQVSDFGSNQSTIRVKVYQITNLVGRGKPATGVF